MPITESLLQQSIYSHQSGDFVAAATGYAKVLADQPGNADAWHLAGVLAYQNGRPLDGIKQIQMAIGINPGNAEYFSNLAAILNGSGQHDAALDAGRRSVQIDLNSSQGHFQIAKALTSLNHLADATDSFEQAIKNGGDEVSIDIELANILQMQGNIPEAVNQLENALARAPEQPQIYVELAKFVPTGHFTFAADQLESLTQLANDTNTFSSDNRGRLFSALATTSAEKKKFSTAYRYFESANRCMAEYFRSAKGVDFDPQSNQEFVEQTINYFSEQRIAEMQTHGSASSLPVFVVGMPRSGTTLIHQLLSNHEAIAGLGELTFVNDLFFDVFGTPNRSDVQAWPHLSDQRIRSTSDQYLAKINDLLRSELTQRAIDKMPGNYNFVGFIKTLFPKSKIIHCVRDPRDVCLSCYFTLFNDPHLQAATSSISNIVDLYHSYRRLMNRWKNFFPADIYDLSYRKLVCDPASEMTSLLEFLDLPFDEDCTQINAGCDSIIRTASVAQARKPVNQSSLGKWRNYESHLAPFLKQLEPEILEFENADRQ